MRKIAVLVFVACFATIARAAPVDTATRVEVRGPRVHAKDVFPGNVPDVDLGPTPPIGATRVIERADIERAFADAKAAPPKKIPSSVRVSRKTRRLSSLEIDGAVKTALAAQKLPRGAELVRVRASALEVADDYHHVVVELPPLPRRAGPTTVAATVTFMSQSADTPIYRVVLPLDLALPPEAAFADIPKGAPVTIVVRKGLVEVSLPGTAATDGDIGGVVPVQLRPSGRVVRCRAMDRDHALLLEDS